MSIKALIVKNEINLPDEVRDRLQVLAQSNSISYLDRDREPGLFMLFCTGQSFESIALQTNLPIEVIYLTAMHYRWMEKSAILRKDAAAIQKDIVNGMLVATTMAVKEELQDIIAGRKSARSSSLIPKNVSGIDALIKLSNTVNGIVTAETPKSGTVIQATNVQINNNVAEDGVAKKEVLVSEEEKEAKYALVTKKRDK